MMMMIIIIIMIMIIGNNDLGTLRLCPFWMAQMGRGIIIIIFFFFFFLFFLFLFFFFGRVDERCFLAPPKSRKQGRAALTLKLRYFTTTLIYLNLP